MERELIIVLIGGYASILAALGGIYYKLGQNGARAEAVEDRVLKIERKLGWIG